MTPRLQEILENHAFMTKVMKIGLEGVEVHDWVKYLVHTVGGYIGDLNFTTSGSVYRVVAAVSEPPFDQVIRGSDIPVKMMALLNDRFARMHNPLEAYGVSSITKMLRDGWLQGGRAECSISGEGVDLDFVRGRHSLSSPGMVEALYVHGRLLICDSTQPSSMVEAISDQGECMLADGTLKNFYELSKIQTGPLINYRDSIIVQGISKGLYSYLSNLVVKNMLSQYQGPSPQGMLISKGEDGNILVVASLGGELHDKGLSLKVLPGCLQILSHKNVIAQTQYGDFDQVSSFIRSGDIQLANFMKDSCEVVQLETL